MLYISTILYSIYRQLSIGRAHVIIFVGGLMISYEPFYRTIKEKNISTYKLINQYGISRSLLDRLKHNKPITTVTLNDLCKILNCRIDEIIVYVEE